MRVTRETLIRIAKETVQQRRYGDRTIIAAYLTGSLLTEQPFLGGVTDIDLVFVHAEKPAVRREIAKLPSDFHIDITHNTNKDYEPPRELRVNPWLGYEIYAPMLLYETQHFFEYTQASVRATFHEPITVIQRAHNLLDHGRQIWIDLTTEIKVGPKQVARYLKAVSHAANAIAELNGPPLAERRFLLEFPARAEALELPGLTTGLLGLLGANNLDASTLAAWLPEWQAAYQSAAETGKADERLHPARLAYYQKAFEALLAGENPITMLWPLLRTWTLAAAVLPAGQIKSWQEACAQLGLTAEGFAQRVQGLDHYLDGIEELLENMAAAHGLASPESR